MDQSGFLLGVFTEVKIIQIKIGNKEIGVDLLLLLFVYRLAMDYIYKQIISPIYEYSGFVFAPTIRMILLSWILLFISAVFISKYYMNKEESLSNELVFFIYLLSFIPFTSMIAAGVFDDRFILFNSIYWFSLIVLSQLIWAKIPRMTVSDNIRTTSATTVISIISIVSVVVVLYVSGRYAHFRFLFSFENVYGYREEASNYAIPKLLVYLFSWTKWLNVVLIAYYLRKKQILWVVLLLFVQLLSFSYDGMKGTLFATILVIGASFLSEYRLGSFNRHVLELLVALAIACILEFRVLHSISLSSLFFRRTMFLPALLSSYYVEFFSKNVPDYFRASFLRHFGFSTPYPDLGHIIATTYFDRPGMNSNNGLIADAVTNFGFAGIVIAPVLLGFLFKIIDYVSDDMDVRLVAPIAAALATGFLNSFIMTILLTHGLLAIILVLLFVKRDKKSQWRRLETSARL